MNDFWKSIFGGLFRTTLATASGYAVAKGTISASDAAIAIDSVSAVAGAVTGGSSTAIIGAAGALLTAGLSIWQKFKASRQ